MTERAQLSFSLTYYIAKLPKILLSAGFLVRYKLTDRIGYWVAQWWRNAESVQLDDIVSIQKQAD
jgi:hypothetical protein